MIRVILNVIWLVLCGLWIMLHGLSRERII